MAGSYGFLNEGQEAIVKDSVAKELVSAGLAEAVSDEQPEEPKTEAVSDEPAVSSVKIKGGKLK